MLADKRFVSTLTIFGDHIGGHLGFEARQEHRNNRKEFTRVENITLNHFDMILQYYLADIRIFRFGGKIGGHHVF